jgi:hypothetical protein
MTRHDFPGFPPLAIAGACVLALSHFRTENRIPLFLKML